MSITITAEMFREIREDKEYFTREVTRLDGENGQLKADIVTLREENIRLREEANKYRLLCTDLELKNQKQHEELKVAEKQIDAIEAMGWFWNGRGWIDTNGKE